MTRLRYLLTAIVSLGPACLTEELPSEHRWSAPGSDGGPPPASECDVTAFYRPVGATPGRVMLSAEWNGWSPDQLAMSDEDGDGTFEATLTLRPGRYGYKLVVDDVWMLDPQNPYTLWQGGVENSLLRVRDCSRPELVVQSASATAEGTLSAVVEYRDGIAAAGADANASRVLLDGEPLEVLLVDGRFEVDATGLALGKHTLRFEAADLEGRRAQDATVPFWVEPEPFAWEDAILYFVFTDRFRNGDPNNDAAVDGVSEIANYMGGDLRGVLDAIEEGYFDSLGVRALWLSPVMTNTDLAQPGIDGRMYSGYHGYWPSEPRSVEERFGDLELLREVVSAAHRHGIRVLLDLVANHVHSDHPYFREHRMEEWFYGDGSCVCGQGECGWDTHSLDCWFMSYLPDLSYENPDVVDAMTEDALFWAREVDVDGFRLDAVKHMLHVAGRTLASRINDELELSGLRYYLVGETFTGDDGRAQIAEYLGQSELDGQFDFPLYWPIVRVLERREGSMRELDSAVLANEGAYPSGTVMSPFLGNHDVPRAISHAAGQIADQWGNGSKEQGWNDPPDRPSTDLPYERLVLSFLFLLTQPGTPLIYYGDEVGLPGAGDPDNRRMMPDEDLLTARERNLRGRVQAIGQARRDSRALRRGIRRTLWVDDEVYVYSRGDGGDVAVIAINVADVERVVDVPVPGSLGLGAGTRFEDRLGGAGVTVANGSLHLVLGPRRGALFVQ